MTENPQGSGFRLSPQQERLVKDFSESEMPPAVVRLRVDGTFDRSRLEQAITRVADRHEILRTSLRRQVGIRMPLQIVEPAGAIQASVLGDAGTSIDLSLSPTCADTTTLALLADEVAAAYFGMPPKNPEPVQYADYAEWQQQNVAGDDEAAQRG